MSDPVRIGDIIINPDKKGYYRCPFKCGRSDYPQPKWKTKKGIEGHLAKCPNRPSILAEKEFVKSELAKSRELIKNEFIANGGIIYKIGDTVNYIQEIITKPTHVRGGTRMMRIRYEPDKRFEARTVKIFKIDIIFMNDNPLVLYNNSFYQNDIKESHEIAKQEAKHLHEEYQKYLEECSRCR